MKRVGAIDIEAYRDRDNRWRARVTLTDPTWTWEPYVPPPQLTDTTETGRARLADALKDAGELAEMMATRAVINEMTRKQNV